MNRLPPLLAGGPARIVNLSSAGHRFSNVVLDRRGRDAGQRACAVHPGTIHTELGRFMTEETFASLPLGRAEQQTIWKSIPAGAATSLWAGFVADADAIGGRYCEDCRVATSTADPTSRTGVSAYALDPGPARALWTRSEELARESFPT